MCNTLIWRRGAYQPNKPASNLHCLCAYLALQLLLHLYLYLYLCVCICICICNCIFSCSCVFNCCCGCCGFSLCRNPSAALWCLRMGADSKTFISVPSTLSLFLSLCLWFYSFNELEPVHKSDTSNFYLHLDFYLSLVSEKLRLFLSLHVCIHFDLFTKTNNSLLLIWSTNIFHNTWKSAFSSVIYVHVSLDPISSWIKSKFKPSSSLLQSSLRA